MSGLLSEHALFGNQNFIVGPPGVIVGHTDVILGPPSVIVGSPGLIVAPPFCINKRCKSPSDNRDIPDDYWEYYHKISDLKKVYNLDSFMPRLKDRKEDISAWKKRFEQIYRKDKVDDLFCQFKKLLKKYDYFCKTKKETHAIRKFIIESHKKYGKRSEYRN